MKITVQLFDRESLSTISYKKTLSFSLALELLENLEETYFYCITIRKYFELICMVMFLVVSILSFHHVVVNKLEDKN